MWLSISCEGVRTHPSHPPWLRACARTDRQDIYIVYIPVQFDVVWFRITVHIQILVNAESYNVVKGCLLHPVETGSAAVHFIFNCPELTKYPFHLLTDV